MSTRPVPDVLCVGRISIDLYAEQVGVPLEQVVSFRQSVGGTATNVAVAVARLGHRAALATRVGDDPFGHFARHELEHCYGVDASRVIVDPDRRTPLAFAVMESPDEPSLDFHRRSAPDLAIAPGEVGEEIADRVRVLWVPASRFSAEPSRSTVRGLLAARAQRRHTILDLDWRPSFWPDPATASARLSEVLSCFDVVVGNREECAVAVGTADPVEAAGRLLDRGPTTAVVKLGADGVLVASADSGCHHHDAVRVPVRCGLGAGDAFGGALCHGLLEGWDLDRAARFAGAAGALVASRLLCAAAMPTVAEVDDLLEVSGAR